MQVECVEVSPGGLPSVGVKHSQHLYNCGLSRLLCIARHALHLAQAWIMVVTLERNVAQAAQRCVQARQLAVDELVHQRVGLGCDAKGDLVFLCCHCRRQQVGHGFAYAGARLERSAGACRQRGVDLKRHVELLCALLVVLVHAPGCAIGAKGVLYRLFGGKHHLAFLLRRKYHLHVAVYHVLRPAAPQGPLLPLGKAQRRLREQMSQRPVRCGAQACDEVCQAFGQRVDAGKQQTPQTCCCLNIVCCSMRALRQAKGAGEVLEAMAAHAWQDDARQSQAVHPLPCDVSGFGLSHDDCLVKRGIVGNKVAPVCPLRKHLNRKAWVWLAVNIGVGDSRELCDLLGDGALGVYKGLESVYDLWPAQYACCDLYDLVSRWIEPCRLCVYNHNLVFKELEAVVCPVCERSVPVHNLRRRAGDKKAAVKLVFHMVQPTMHIRHSAGRTLANLLRYMCPSRFLPSSHTLGYVVIICKICNLAHWYVTLSPASLRYSARNVPKRKDRI